MRRNLRVAKRVIGIRYLSTSFFHSPLLPASNSRKTGDSMHKAASLTILDMVEIHAGLPGLKRIGGFALRDTVFDDQGPLKPSNETIGL